MWASGSPGRALQVAFLFLTWKSGHPPKRGVRQGSGRSEARSGSALGDIVGLGFHVTEEDPGSLQAEEWFGLSWV